jgi:DNA-binding NarL/FixJ family response regulator
VKTRIVIADNSEPYLALLVVVLGNVPQLEIIGTATDGREAVRLSVDNEADIALLDIEMPVLDGVAAALAIRRERPQTELLLHTAAMFEERRRLGAELGLRVFDKLHLNQTVDLVAERGRHHAA